MDYDNNERQNYKEDQRTEIKRYSGLGILALTLCSGLGFDRDGSNEPGFVPPPADRKLPAPPPRTLSSAETFNACCCCPVTPMSRTEAKKPPQPPIAIVKLKH